MEKDIINRIIQVEQEIQEQLATERQKAAALLKQVRRETTEALAQEEARLEAELSAAVAAIRAGGAQEQVASLLAETGAWADRLASLDDDSLRRLVLRELSWLVPGDRS